MSESAVLLICLVSFLMWLVPTVELILIAGRAKETLDWLRYIGRRVNQISPPLPRPAPPAPPPHSGFHPSSRKCSDCGRAPGHIYERADGTAFCSGCLTARYGPPE